MLGIDLDPFFLTCVTAGTLALYNGQRLVKLNRFQAKTDHLKWVESNRTLLIGLTLIGGFITVVCLYFVPWQIWLKAWPLGVIALLYPTPVFPGPDERKALRELPGIKILLIGLVWTGVTLWMPMRLGGHSMSNGSGLLLLERMLFIMAITIPFDIRDLPYDAPHMRTIPQMLGMDKAKWVAVVFLLVSISLALLSAYLEIVPWMTGLGSAMVYLLSIRLVQSAKVDSHFTHFTGSLDGMMLLYGILAILLSYSM